MKTDYQQLIVPLYVRHPLCTAYTLERNEVSSNIHLNADMRHLTPPLHVTTTFTPNAHVCAVRVCVHVRYPVT